MPGFVGADLANVVNEAALHAAEADKAAAWRRSATPGRCRPRTAMCCGMANCLTGWMQAIEGKAQESARETVAG